MNISCEIAGGSGVTTVTACYNTFKWDMLYIYIYVCMLDNAIYIYMSGPLYCFYHARWVCTDVFPSVGKGRPSIVPPAHHRGPLPSQRCMHAPSPSCFVKGIKVLPSFPFRPSRQRSHQGCGGRERTATEGRRHVQNSVMTCNQLPLT